LQPCHIVKACGGVGVGVCYGMERGWKGGCTSRIRKDVFGSISLSGDDDGGGGGNPCKSSSTGGGLYFCSFYLPKCVNIN